MKRYNVYEIIPNSLYYGGMSLVAAESTEEANDFIDEFIKSDTQNYNDSLGYNHIDEYNIMDHLYSDEKGIIYYGIYCCG